MLSHGNLLATARMYVEQLGFDDTHSLYQFLPLAHVLARVAQIVALSVGARIIYWSGDPAKIIDELRETSPTHFPAVPRIYEKLHSAALGRVARGAAGSASAVRVGAALRYQCAHGAVTGAEQPDLLTDLQYRLADRLVLSKVRACSARSSSSR